MKIRSARKQVVTFPKRLIRRLNILYPPYYNEKGKYIQPSWASYYRFAKSWTLIKRKVRKYQEQFKLL